MDEKQTSTRSSNNNSSTGKIMIMVGPSSCSSSCSTSLKRIRCGYNSNNGSSNNSLDDDVSEDVWFEILLRVPDVNSIFKFMSVSKPWLSLLSDPFFITSRQRIINTFSTLFLQSDFGKEDGTMLIKSISIEEEDNQSLFKSHDDGCSFKFLSEQVYIVASSNGLVLLSTTKYYKSRYIVCNPLTKKWVFLPPPQNTSKWTVNGFICESSLINSTSYKVVHIPQMARYEAPSFGIEVFSSEMGEWNTYNVLYPQETTILNYKLTNAIVTNNGILYWMGDRNIIAYDLNKPGGQCRVINSPRGESIRYLVTGWCIGMSEEGGLIRYCETEIMDFISMNNLLVIWVLEEDDYFNGGGQLVWRLIHKINLPDVLIENKSNINEWSALDMLESLTPLVFNTVDGNVLVLGSCGICIAAYNIRTKTLKVLRRRISPSCYSGYSVLPFAVTPWPTSLPQPT